MAITGINNSSCTSYYASDYKKTSRPGVTKTEQIKTEYTVTGRMLFSLKLLLRLHRPSSR